MEENRNRRPASSGRAVRSPRDLGKKPVVPDNWSDGVVRTVGGIDRVFLALVILLVCLGSVMVFSASYPYALSKYEDSLYFVKKQALFVGLGFGGMWLTSRIPCWVYRKMAPVLYAISCIFLILTLFMGYSEGEAKRWLGIPGSGLSFQPSETMKPALVMVLGWYFQRNRDYIIEKSKTDRLQRYLIGVLVPVALIGVACGLVLAEKHLSGTAIIALIGASVLIIGGCRLLPTFLTCAVPGALAAVGYVTFIPYAKKRLTDFLTHSGSDEVTDERWQTVHGLWAISSGGLLGLGLGQSRLKYQWVSMAHNDFIFTIWCEETGFVGAVALIALFAMLVWRGYLIALRAPDTFSCLTAFGLSTHVAIQVLLNIAVVTDLIPNTGISLPFFSYGGSSLFFLMLEMGVVLSISRHSYQKR